MDNGVEVRLFTAVEGLVVSKDSTLAYFSVFSDFVLWFDTLQVFGTWLIYFAPPCRPVSCFCFPPIVIESTRNERPFQAFFVTRQWSLTSPFRSKSLTRECLFYSFKCDLLRFL